MIPVDLESRLVAAALDVLPPALVPTAALAFVVTDLAGRVVADGDPPPSSSSPVYCAGRMPLQMVVARDVECGRYRFDDMVASLAPQYSGTWVGSLCLDDVLLHTPGLHAVPGVAARMMGRGQLTDAIRALGPPSGPDAEVETRYSDYVVGHVLGDVVEHAHGESYRAVVRAAVGSAGTAGRPDAVDSANRSIRSGAFVDCRTDRPLLALGDCMPDNLGRWNPAFGWFASPTGMATSVAAMWASLSVASHDALVETRRSSPWDPELERPLSMGRLGCTEYLGTDTCGLAGQGGISYCGVAPARDRIVAWTVSPALPTPAALARSTRLAQVLCEV